jgi:hypothetical protein
MMLNRDLDHSFFLLEEKGIVALRERAGDAAASALSKTGRMTKPHQAVGYISHPLIKQLSEGDQMIEERKRLEQQLETLQAIQLAMGAAPPAPAPAVAVAVT